MKKTYLFTVALSIAVMLLLPWMTVLFVRGDGGMAVCFLLFFCVDPLFCVASGILAGWQKQPLWLVPLIPSAAFLAGTWLIFEPGEPAFVRYALVYLLIGAAAFIISRCAYRYKNRGEAQ